MTDDTSESVRFLLDWIEANAKSNKGTVFRQHVKNVLAALGDASEKADRMEAEYLNAYDNNAMMRTLFDRVMDHILGRSNDRRFSKLEESINDMREQIGPKLDELIKQKLAAEQESESLQGEVAELTERLRG